MDAVSSTTMPGRLPARGPATPGRPKTPTPAGGIDQIVRQREYRNRFDYVFVGSWDAHPKAHARVQSAEIAFDQPIEGIWASDHSGVVADLEVGSDA